MAKGIKKLQIGCCFLICDTVKSVRLLPNNSKESFAKIFRVEYFVVKIDAAASSLKTSNSTSLHDVNTYNNVQQYTAKQAT
jgi:hypothetical protein